MKKLTFAVLLLLLSTAGRAAEAQTITVTAGTDPIDIDWQTATVADLPGPDGKVSFSEAMIAANHTPGHQTIAFAVPRSEWQMQWLYPNRAVIWTSYSYFWRASESITLDGTTQTAFSGDTNSDGAEIVLFGGDPYFNADDCVVRGMDNSRININGSRALVADNTAVGITVYGGAGSLIQRNTGGTLQIDRSNDNVVVGNTFLRVRVLGWFDGGQPATGNRIGGPASTDRNVIIGLGTWNSEGAPGGFAVQLFDTEGTILQNNSIGTTSDGLAQGHQATTSGVHIEGRNTNLTVRGNRIAGILGHGIGPHYAGWLFGQAIYLTGSGDGLDIVGNTIGLDANGQPSLGSLYGINAGTWFTPSLLHLRIGGPNPGDGNTIAGHRLNGIIVGRQVQDARISGNAIYANEQIGIDLVTDLSAYGVTPNDPGDADAGANGLQNFPVIQSASTTGASVHLAGTLQSEASALYRLEFFASPGCDASGNGEGQVYLGYALVTTDAVGNRDFDVTLSGAAAPGSVLTATATRESTGATSEFSACRTLTGNVADVKEPIVESTFHLAPAAPNPFQGSTTLRYQLTRDGIASLAIYDIGGRLVRELISGTQAAGPHQVAWDGLDGQGRAVASGIYLVKLRSGADRMTQRVIVAR